MDSKIPSGPIEDKWDKHRNNISLMGPGSREQFKVIVVGTGLAGASAASTLAELGYHVQSFCIQDSPRRAHSVAAQGGINAAKNYANDGDSVQRLFYDTIKGGDFRAREANVYRLAQLSNNIIDHCVAQGIPFSRDYSGHLANRSFGGAQVSRTFYVRGQTGQQLLLGAYGALMREVAAGKIELFPRREMVDLVVVDGKARGIIVRNLVSGAMESYSADAVIIATGGYANVYNLSTNAMSSNASAIWRAHKRGAFFANPSFTQIHPTCIPVSGDHQSKLTLMSESLRNDGRVWVPKNSSDIREVDQIPTEDRDYFLERRYAAYGNLVPRDVASRAIKQICDQGKGIGRSVYLDFSEAINNFGVEYISERYGNIFDMYQKIIGVDPYKTPMKIYPSPHYSMGGLWVDYNLQTTIPGLFAIGEANFADHGANRLGASALMQGLADGYFIIPHSLGNYFASTKLAAVNTERDEFKNLMNESNQRLKKLLSIKGGRTVDDFHRQLGKVLWDNVGMARNGDGLMKAKKEIGKIKEEFWQNVSIPADSERMNFELEKAQRVSDYLELGELMAEDGKLREESCGCHFREEYQSRDSEPLRDDENFCHVSGWEYNERGEVLHVEPLVFEEIKLSQRSYK